MITETSTHIVIPYLNGTWRVIAADVYQDRKIFWIEREQKGYLIDKLVVDEEGNLVRRD